MEYIHFLWFPWLKIMLVILGLNDFQCLTVITLPLSLSIHLGRRNVRDLISNNIFLLVQLLYIYALNNALLVFQFVRGADPILKLHDENNDVKEVLRCV